MGIKKGIHSLSARTKREIISHTKRPESVSYAKRRSSRNTNLEPGRPRIDAAVEKSAEHGRPRVPRKNEKRYVFFFSHENPPRL